MYAFYIQGINDFQDMLAPLLRMLYQGKKCWVCIFDCHQKKRQFYYYTEQELVAYVREVCAANKVAPPEISFFGINDEKKFSIAYEDKKPGLVFAQCIFHKYPAWVPQADKSNIIHFAWGTDGIENLRRSPYKNIVLNVLRYPGDKKHFIGNSHYFGNFRHEQLLYNPISANLDLPFDDEDLMCYIPETWEDYNRDPSRVLSITNAAIKEIKSRGYKIVWKKREKGYPTDNKTSMLKKLDVQPDFAIEKDLYFPTSLLYFPLKSNINICFGKSCALDDALSLLALDNDLAVEYSNDTIDIVCEFLNKNKDSLYNKESSMELSLLETPSVLLLKYLEENNWI